MLSIVAQNLDGLVSSGCARCDGLMSYYRAAVAVRDERPLGKNDESVTKGSVLEVSNVHWETRRVYQQKTEGLGQDKTRVP